jgi:predicted transposase YdaD
MLGLVELQETRVYQEGLEVGARSLILKLLTRKLGNIPTGVRSQVEALSTSQLEALGEALLDFSEIADLTHWLQTLS